MRDKLKAYMDYKSKLRLLGDGNDSHEDVFNIEIAVDVVELAKYLNYPETLKIPSFVDKIRKRIIIESPVMENLFKKIPDDYVPPKRTTANVKKIIIPDDMKLDAESRDELQRFSNLKTISITDEQFNTALEERYTCEIRYT